MIDMNKFDEAEFNKSFVTLQDLANEAVGHESSMAVFNLPIPIEKQGNVFTAMSMVKLKNGKKATLLTRFDEQGVPLFALDEFIMSNFLKE